MRPIVIITGPTAAGKTALVMNLAEHHPVDLINVDSAQVYRGMDIGTAKPDPSFLERYPHALIDIKDPEETYSVAEFVVDAKRAIDAAHQAKRWPVLVGGTALYLRAILYGIDPLPSADPALRSRLEAEAKEKGWEAMHRELIALDPGLMNRVKPTDRQRIQRFWEIALLTGKRPSELWSENRNAIYPSCRIVVTPPDRATLHQRMERRLDEMLAAGFLDEVAELMRRDGLSADHSSMRSVGYRQAWAYLEKPGQTLKDVRALILAATRQLAKRQLTAFRKLSQSLWYDSQSPKLEEMTAHQIASVMERVEND